MMEAARTSETLLNFYQTTRRYNPEDSHLLTQMLLGRQKHGSVHLTAVTKYKVAVLYKQLTPIGELIILLLLNKQLS
jgi:hypothetical protein